MGYKRDEDHPKIKLESLEGFDPAISEIMNYLRKTYRLILATTDNAPLEDVINLHNTMEKYSRRIGALIDIMSEEDR